MRPIPFPARLLNLCPSPPFHPTAVDKDVLRLLSKLDVATHEGVAEKLLRELIAGGILDPVAVATAAGDAGLRRGAGAEPLTPGAARGGVALSLQTSQSF